MKNVLVISGSPRRNGNSDILSEQFAKGAEKSGNQVEHIFIRDLKLGYCTGCGYCLKNGKCNLKDELNDILPKLLEADVICFSSPVYCYSVTGQMKVFLDRCSPLIGKMKDKDFYYMVTAWDTLKENLDITMQTFHGFAICFENIREKGRVYAGDTDKKGDVKNTQAYEEAYNMGLNIG